MDELQEFIDQLWCVGVPPQRGRPRACKTVGNYTSGIRGVSGCRGQSLTLPRSGEIILSESQYGTAQLGQFPMGHKRENRRICLPPDCRTCCNRRDLGSFRPGGNKPAERHSQQATEHPHAGCYSYPAAYTPGVRYQDSIIPSSRQTALQPSASIGTSPPVWTYMLGWRRG